MKLDKQGLKKVITDNITDNDVLATTLLEDIEDSFQDNVVSQDDYNKVTTERDELNTKYNDLMSKYKTRFLSNTVIENPVDEIPKGLEEKKYIDIHSI